MSDDASFDMIRAGKKVRVLNTAQFYEHGARGLSGRNEHMKMTQAEANKLTADLSAEMARLKTMEQRVAALEREKRGESFGPPEYFVPFNRAKGTVGDDR